MPLKRIGEGLAVIGFVAIAAMIVVAILARQENTALVITAVLGFGASTIGGVISLLSKLETIEDKVQENTVLTAKAKDAANDAVTKAEAAVVLNAEVVGEIKKQTNSVVDALREELRTVHARNDELMKEVKKAMGSGGRQGTGEGSA